MMFSGVGLGYGSANLRMLIFTPHHIGDLRANHCPLAFVHVPTVQTHAGNC